MSNKSFYIWDPKLELYWAPTLTIVDPQISAEDCFVLDKDIAARWTSKTLIEEFLKDYNTRHKTSLSYVEVHDIINKEEILRRRKQAFDNYIIELEE